MGLLSIPGNIKQQYLPFVLNPKNKLHQYASESGQIDPDARAQFFSFKPRFIDYYGDNGGLLNICPSSLRDSRFEKFLNQDISFMTLFKETEKKPITVDDMLNALPGIQIREYLPDTRLDQMFNICDILVDVIKNIAGGGASNIVDLAKWIVDGGLGEFLADPVKTQKLKDTLSYIIDWIICAETANGRNLIKKADGKDRFAFPGGNRFKSYLQNNKDINKIFSLPYTIYYKLQSCVTTNIYELPSKIDMAFDVNGKEGWGSGRMGIGNDFLKKIPGIGDMLKSMFGNVRINYMNWWDAESGSKTEEPEFTIKFSLFNDTDKSAMANFIFVNTLVPNNMWIQYGLFQHSSHIYDVKIDGHKRLFACAGSVKVQYKGVLRNPPPTWVRLLINKHGNNSLDKDRFFYNVYYNNLIKIPDVYEVELQFKSMLPQNFNTYLYQFSDNARIDTEYVGKSVYEASSISSFMKDMSSGLGDDARDYIENYKTYKGEDAGSTDNYKGGSDA